MKYSVNVTEEAKQDLHSIFMYILNNSYSLDIASRRVYELEKAILSLETMPYRHQALFHEDQNREMLRIFHIIGYAIVYEIDETEKYINVLAVFNDKQRLPSRVSEDVTGYSY